MSGMSHTSRRTTDHGKWRMCAAPHGPAHGGRLARTAHSARIKHS